MDRPASESAVAAADVHWLVAVAGISGMRYEFIDDELVVAYRNLHLAEQAVQPANAKYQAAKARFGKRSGHKRLQQAESAADKTKRQRKYCQAEVDRLRKSRGMIDIEHDQLVAAIWIYLSGNEVPQRCGSIMLKLRDKGDLYIYFRKDGQRARPGKYDGKYILQPDGKMYSMFVR